MRTSEMLKLAYSHFEMRDEGRIGILLQDDKMIRKDPAVTDFQTIHRVLGILINCTPFQKHYYNKRIFILEMTTLPLSATERLKQAERGAILSNGTLSAKTDCRELLQSECSLADG